MLTAQLSIKSISMIILKFTVTWYNCLSDKKWLLCFSVFNTYTLHIMYAVKYHNVVAVGTLCVQLLCRRKLFRINIKKKITFTERKQYVIK